MPKLTKKKASIECWTVTVVLLVKLPSKGGCCWRSCGINKFGDDGSKWSRRFNTTGKFSAADVSPSGCCIFLLEAWTVSYLLEVVVGVIWKGEKPMHTFSFNAYVITQVQTIPNDEKCLVTLIILFLQLRLNISHSGDISSKCWTVIICVSTPRHNEHHVLITKHGAVFLKSHQTWTTTH